MRKDDSRRGAVGKPLACLALSLMATGCGSLGQTPGLSARSADVSIAFESIDGPPRETSQMLVRDIDEEAAALRIAVVPTGGEASYRLRGYLAAHAQGATTSIAWAWDVYDAELHRVFRLSGEERAGPAAGRGAEDRIWAAADEALLRRIARNGMEQLAGFMASPPAPAAPTPPMAPAPGRNGQVVASRDNAPSESAGSLRSEARAGRSGTGRIADATADR